MEINYLSYLFLLLAGFSNGLMDLIAYRYYLSIFNKSKFFNPNVSWRNKWKNGNPEYGERFLFSSTIFVFLTDGWHLVKWFMIKFILLSVIFHKGQDSLLNYLMEVPFLFMYYVGFWLSYESKMFKWK
jgi:hypothetical protein